MPTAVFDNGVATISVGSGLDAGQYAISLVGIVGAQKVSDSLGSSNQVALSVASMVIADADTFAAAVQAGTAAFTFRDSGSRVWRVRFVA